MIKKFTKAQIVGGMIAVCFILILNIVVNFVMMPSVGLNADNQLPPYKGNMKFLAEWNEKTIYKVNKMSEVPVVTYKGSLYIANGYTVENGIPPNESKDWFKVSGGGGGGDDNEARYAIRELKGTDKFDSKPPITLKATLENLNTLNSDIDTAKKDITGLKTDVGNKADKDKVVSSISIEGKTPAVGDVNFKAGNTNIEIAKDGQDISWSPKGQAGGVTSLFGLTGDIGLKSSDDSITYTKDGNDIDSKAKGGTGGVESIFGLTGKVGLKSSDNTIKFVKDGQDIDVKGQSTSGVTSINGISGAVVATSPKGSIEFNPNGQNLEMESKGGSSSNSYGEVLINNIVGIAADKPNDILTINQGSGIIIEPDKKNKTITIKKAVE